MAGTVIQTFEKIESAAFRGNRATLAKLTFECACEAAAATIPNTATSAEITAAIQGLFFIKCINVPGTTTAPTDNCEVLITDEYGIDMLGGLGTDWLDAVGNKEIYPTIAGKGGCQPVIGALTLDVDNNLVNAATWDIICIFSKYPLSVNGLT